MITNIYHREIATMYLAFLTLVLSGCTAGQAANLPAPPSLAACVNAKPVQMRVSR